MRNYKFCDLILTNRLVNYFFKMFKMSWPKILFISSIFCLTLNLNAESQNLKPKINDFDDSPEVIEKEEHVVLNKPDFQALISVSKGLNPLGLDSSDTKTFSLPDALNTALNNNLTLKINYTGYKSQEWLFYSSLGKFLPDILMSYTDRYLKGTPVLPGFGKINVDTPFIITTAGFRQYVYQGGKVLFGAMQAKNRQNAQLFNYKALTNDVLLQTVKLYNNLLLNQAFLRIRIRAVNLSKEQLNNNIDMQENGIATKLDVLQSKTQLSKDRQALIAQQVASRVASVQLSSYLNINMADNLNPVETVLSKRRLISKKMDIAKLLQIAIDNRNELKQYEQLRLAAKRAIIIATSPLQPNVQVFGNIYGVGPTLANKTIYSKPNYQPVALSGSTGSTTAIAPIQTGLSPVTLPVASAYSPVGAAYMPPTATNSHLGSLYTIGFGINWNFLGLGVTDMANIRSSQWLAKQAGHQQTAQLISVLEQVRTSYLNSLAAEKEIEETTDQVISAEQELEFAKLRMQNGVGRNIDVLQAQLDRTTALLSKSQAIINFNNAQAQLLHDIGLANITNLLAKKPLIR